MKICGACGLELDKSRYSNKQWQLSRQKRRCRGCVDKGTPPGPSGEGQAVQGGDDDGHEAEPRPPVEIPGGVGCAGEGEADDVGCTNVESDKGQADGD
ncbi:hypothetical protein THAOC_31854, partial [Thalassiosira oceanica]